MISNGLQFDVERVDFFRYLKKLILKTVSEFL